MKKLFKCNRLQMLTVLSGSLLLLGCTNADYEFKKVDTTFGFGDGQLTLPSNNSVVVTLDDILNLGSTDLITTDANGDYRFGKDPESVDAVKVDVDPITNAGSTTFIPIDPFTLNDALSSQAGKTVKLSDFGLDPLSVDQNITAFNYSFDVPDEVVSLSQVTLQSGGAELSITLTLPAVSKLKKFTLTLPQQLVVTNAGIGTLTGNTLTLAENYTMPSTQKLELKFKVTDIKASVVNHKFTLQDNVKLQVEVDEVKVPSPWSSSVTFQGEVTLSTMTVTKATGVFAPTIDAQQVGSTTINSLPEFLTDSRVVADIDNPQIWLDITSDLPLGGTVEARLGSSTLNGYVELTKANGNALTIGANTTTRLVICRKAPENLSGYTPVIASNLSDIVKKLDEGMKVTIDITSFEADQTTSTIELGHDYTLTPAYQFTAPLALGDDAVIIYNKNEGDWNKDIKDIQLSTGAKAMLTATVENSVPADLKIDITPLDNNSKTLTELTVKPIKNTVAAGVTNGEIQYEITDNSGKGLKQLDGVNYILNVTAPSADAQKGKTLNKQQKILIKDIKLQLNGNIVVDAN